MTSANRRTAALFDAGPRQVAEASRTEGFFGGPGRRRWYGTYGDLGGSRPPLVVVHGGPGYPHYGLEPLAALADRGQPVVFYDQLGCGRSDRPEDPSLWTVELFVEELGALRDALGLDRVHLLGHSWGGTLVIEYLLTGPAGVDKAVLSSPLVDTALWIEEADRLKDELAPEVAATMRRHEAAGTTDTEEYLAAYQAFKERFVCRIVPLPEPLRRAEAEFGRQVYETMWGPSEAHATGTLKGYSALGRLPELSVPVLFVSGRHDEATPRQIERAHRATPGSRWVLLEESAHSGCLEQTALYLAVVADFLEPAALNPG